MWLWGLVLRGFLGFRDVLCFFCACFRLFTITLLGGCARGLGSDVEILLQRGLQGRFGVYD